MLSLIPINILRFVALMAAQVLIFSNIKFSPFINPYVYPLFILLLPFSTPRWLLLILGFATGLTLDVFVGSLGMHAAACLLIAYIRPTLISIITPKGAEFEVEPNINLQGVTWFLIYCSLATLIHHTAYFLIESGTFYNPLIAVVRILLSTVFSVLFMMIFLFLFTSSKKRRLA
jgi:rod shape-determining protein MreD